MKTTRVFVLSSQREPWLVRCCFQSGALGVTEEVGVTGGRKRDPVWRVVHLPSGGAMPTAGLTAADAIRLIGALESVLKWERYQTYEEVAALGRRTKARIRRVIDEVLDG